MKISGNELRVGFVINHKGSFWIVVTVEHVKPGKGGAYSQVELKGLASGTKLNERFRSAENVERMYVDERAYQFLFASSSSESFTFMDKETYEQVDLTRNFIGNKVLFLQENMDVKISFCDKNAVSITLPQNVVCVIRDTEPSIKGQTATGSYKPAVLENGVRITIPPFVVIGEKVIVNTETLTYVRRAE